MKVASDDITGVIVKDNELYIAMVEGVTNETW